MKQIFNTVHLSKPHVRRTQIKAMDINIFMIMGMMFTIAGVVYIPLTFMGLPEIPLTPLVIAFALIYYGHRKALRKLYAEHMRKAMLPKPKPMDFSSLTHKQQMVWSRELFKAYAKYRPPH